MFQGFCLPPDEVETSGEGATEFEDIQGGGVGEGEGMKDVSDQIESEDQVCWITFYYLTEVSKTRQYRIPPFLFVSRTFPAGFP